MARIKVAELFVPIIADSTAFTSVLESSSKEAATWASRVEDAFGKHTFKVMAAGAAAAAAAIGGVGIALGKLAVKAAPLEGIGRAFESMAQEFGVSLDAMREAAAGTINDFELMRQANIALTGATHDVGVEIGKRLPDLLLTARAAAVQTGLSVEYMFWSLINGIKRASPRLIDNTGLVVELGAAHRQAAASMGKSVEEMTQQEKVLATLNVVADQGIQMAERLGLTHLTAADRLMQLRAAFQNVTNDIGYAFTPVVKSAAIALTDLVNRALGPVAHALASTLAPAVDLVIEQLHRLAVVAVDSGQAFIAAHSQAFAVAAENALRWGVNIVTQLAVGLMQGAATVLVAAMNAISAMLSWWLSPGSPPRVAPNLPEWGQAAMEEFLRGFTNASFDILEGVQRPLEQVLGRLVEMELLGEEEALGAFRGISAGLTQAIAQWQTTGAISRKVMDDLLAVGGQFGQSLVNLTQAQFAYAAATREAAAAEEALNKAQEAHDKSQTQLRKEIEKYNRMLRAGAGEEALASQRGVVEAARQRMDAAEEELVAAEKHKEATEKRVDPLKEQVRIQQRLLDQLLRMTEVQKRLEEELEPKPGGGGGGGGGGAKAPKAPKGGGVDIPAIAPIDMGGVPLIDPESFDYKGLRGAFEEARDILKEKFKDIFAPLGEAFETEIKPLFQRISDAWKRMTTLIGQFWDAIHGDEIISKFKSLIPPTLFKNIAKATGAILTFKLGLWALRKVAAAVGLVLLGMTSPMKLLTLGLGLLLTAWEGNWFGIQDAVKRAWGDIKPKLEEFAQQLRERLPRALGELQAKWTELQPRLVELATTIKDRVGESLRGLGQRLTELWPKLRETATRLGSELLSGLQELGTYIVGEFIPNAVDWFCDRLDALGAAWDRLAPKLERVGTVLREKVGGVFDTFSQTLRDLNPAIGATGKEFDTGLLGALQTLATFLGTTFNETLARFRENWAEITPDLQEAGRIINERLGGALQWLGERLGEVLPKLGELAAKAGGVLLTGLMKFSQFVLADLIPGAVQGLAKAVIWLNAKWTELQPVVAGVIEFFTTYVSPVLRDIGEFIGTTLIPLIGTGFATAWQLLNNAISVAVQIWEGVLWPVLRVVGNFIITKLIPFAFVALGAVVIALGAAFRLIAPVIEAFAWFWQNVLYPAMLAVSNFITNTLVPMAIQYMQASWQRLQGVLEILTGVWERVFLPAIEAVWRFITVYLLPLVQALAEFFTATLAAAIRTVAWWFSEKLWPALKQVWEMVKDKVRPILDKLQAFFDGPLKSAIDTVKAALDPVWQVLQDIWQVISDHVLPIFKDMAETVKGSVSDALGSLKDNIIGPLSEAFRGLGDLIQGVINKLREWAEKMRGVHAPPDLERHSPSPFEQALMGVRDQMGSLTRRDLPAFGRAIDRYLDRDLSATVQTNFGALFRATDMDPTERANTNYFNMTVNTRAERATVQRDFAIMQARVPRG